MRSFASLAALASIAFATVASALPTVAGPSGLSRRELAEVETTVKDIATTVSGGNNLNANAVNANSHQSRYVPSDGHHADLANVETIVQGLTNKVGVLDGANVKIANAEATQTTGGGNYKRDGLDAPTGPDTGAATGAIGTVGSTLAGLTQGKTARSEYRGIPDILVELKVKVQSLCDELNADISAAASASIALKASLTILAEIKEHILNARAEIEAVVAANFDGVLCLNGKVLSVHAIAEIYASIVLAISVTLGLVVKACAAVQTDVLIALIVDISVALAACVTLGAKLAVGLIVDIRALIDVVVHIIVELKLEALIQVFQIGAGY